jgi:hypothetical protein
MITKEDVLCLLIAECLFGFQVELVEFGISDNELEP